MYRETFGTGNFEKESVDILQLPFNTCVQIYQVRDSYYFNVTAEKKCNLR